MDRKPLLSPRVVACALTAVLIASVILVPSVFDLIPTRASSADVVEAQDTPPIWGVIDDQWIDDYHVLELWRDGTVERASAVRLDADGNPERLFAHCLIVLPGVSGFGVPQAAPAVSCEWFWAETGEQP